MSIVYPFNYTKHRLYNNTSLDQQLDSIQDRLSNDSDFNNLLKLSKSDVGLRTLLKVIVKNNLTSFSNSAERNRLASELLEILNHSIPNLIDHFMVFEDLAYFFTSKDEIANIGRGSSVGCYVNYLLGITKVNPLDYDLHYNRFLNKNSPILLDFDCGDREDALEYLSNKYGSHFRKIAVELTYKFGSAFKEALIESEIFSTSYNVSVFSNVFNTYRVKNPKLSEVQVFDLVLEQETEFYLFFKFHPSVEEMTRSMLGTFKGYGSHPCSYFLLADDSILDRSDWDDTRTRIKASSVERLKLLKITVLGVNAIKSLNKKAKYSDLKSIHYNDPNVFKKISSVAKDYCTENSESPFYYAETFFGAYARYLEHNGSFPLRSINDMAIIYSFGRSTSNIRGPSTRFDKKYPQLKGILDDSYGSLTFDHDVVKILQELGSFTLEQSFSLLAKMSKNERCDLEREMFNKNAGDVGDLFIMIQAWTRVVFNKPHAIAASHLNYLICHFNERFFTVNQTSSENSE